MSPTLRNMGKPSWAIRRRIIITTLLWCGLIVSYLAVFGEPSSLTEAIATGCLILMASVIGSYVFGAVWDDKTAQPSQVNVDVNTKPVGEE